MLFLYKYTPKWTPRPWACSEVRKNGESWYRTTDSNATGIYSMSLNLGYLTTNFLQRNSKHFETESLKIVVSSVLSVCPFFNIESGQLNRYSISPAIIRTFGSNLNHKNKWSLHLQKRSFLIQIVRINSFWFTRKLIFNYCF